MNRIFPFLYLLFIGLSLNACKVKNYSSGATPVQHQQWDSLLQKHVTAEGWVDYDGFIKDSLDLRSYLNLLSENHPDPGTWTNEERMAYWINAYNAFTVDLIIRHYPVESIKDIKSGIPFVNTVWDIKFINIQGQTYDLNNIEHGILRPKFDEPRIHFAVNCASVSCPKLMNRAYTAERLDQQLDQAARDFINDPSRNLIEQNHLQLSKIFKWYAGDFDGKIMEVIRKYADRPISEDPKVSYLDYDWQLNVKK
jgi:hypothetical protein